MKILIQIVVYFLAGFFVEVFIAYREEKKALKDEAAGIPRKKLIFSDRAARALGRPSTPTVQPSKEKISI